ncbi:MAG: Na+/H+ antiporter subunit E [Microthrixaceae bacterium]
MNRLLPPLIVFVVWIALWGELTWANAASGVVVVVVIGLVIRPVPRRHRVHPLDLARLLGVFAVRLVASSASVVLTVLHPSEQRLRSGVVEVRLRTDSLLVATIVADAISLTPGTLTLEALTAADRGEDPDTDPAERTAPRSSESGGVSLYIHVLGLSGPEEVRTDVAKLEALVLSAVTPLEIDPQAATGAVA